MLVSEWLADMVELARNHPEVRIDADLAPTTTVGRPATLERAFANLLDNAAKWSPTGAHVEVTETLRSDCLKSFAEARVAATALPTGSLTCRPTAALRAPARVASVKVT